MRCSQARSPTRCHVSKAESHKIRGDQVWEEREEDERGKEQHQRRGDMQNWHNLRGGEWIKQEMEETLKMQAQRKIMVPSNINWINIACWQNRSFYMQGG